MDISKCLQSFRSHRLVLLFLAVSAAAFVFVAAVPRSSTCCKNNQVVISSQSRQTPLFVQPTSACLSFLDLDIQGTVWKIAALDTFSIGDLMADLLKKAPCPMIALARDQEGVEYVIVYDEDRRLSLSPVKRLIEQELVEQRNEKFIRVPLSNDQGSSEVCILVR